MKWAKKPPDWLICIDPGRTTGVAVFRHGFLHRLLKISPEEFFRRGPHKKLTGKVVVLVETPRIYPLPKQKGDPNDVLDTGILAGEYIGYYRCLGFVVERVFPKTWKGTIGKPTNRSKEPYLIEQRALIASTAEEKQLIQQTKSARAKHLDHNAVDALGMGLWRLERRKNEVNSIHRRTGEEKQEQQDRDAEAARRGEQSLVRNLGSGRTRRSHGELHESQAG